MGGNHFTFQIDEPGKQRFAHGGGHGEYQVLGPIFVEYVHVASAARDRGLSPKADASYYVAELWPGKLDVRDQGQCLHLLPAYDFETTRLLPARDVDDARRLLAEVVARGMPTVAFIDSERRGDLAVARVKRKIETGRLSLGRSWIEAAGRFSLEPVDGAAPKELVVPPEATYWPTVGDWLVVESANGSVARLLVADDLASARRWAAAIRRDGWPPAPISVTPDGDLATSRLVMEAKVTDGEPGCGRDLIADLAATTRTILTMPRVAAPSGLALRDSVWAVVVARFGPDPCKRTARAVRVYRAPPGMPDHAYQMPSGLVPIVE
jgi:hypothetical protein